MCLDFHVKQHAGEGEARERWRRAGGFTDSYQVRHDGGFTEDALGSVLLSLGIGATRARRFARSWGVDAVEDSACRGLPVAC